MSGEDKAYCPVLSDSATTKFPPAVSGFRIEMVLFWYVWFRGESAPITNESVYGAVPPEGVMTMFWHVLGCVAGLMVKEKGESVLVYMGQLPSPGWAPTMVYSGPTPPLFPWLSMKLRKICVPCGYPVRQ